MLSLITPVLNGAEFIERNICSIEKLKIPFEHIVVDGGSTDGTLEILKKYPHIKVLHQTENSGMYGAIHQGFSVAEFDYITWINSDDTILADNYAQAVKEAYRENYDFIYGDAYILNYVNNKKKFSKTTPFAKYFLTTGLFPLIQPSTFYKKDLYNKTSLRYESFKIHGDLDLFARFAKIKNTRFKYLRKPLSIFLHYNESLGNRSQELCIKEKNGLKCKPTKFSLFLCRLSRFF